MTNMPVGTVLAAWPAVIFWLTIVAGLLSGSRGLARRRPSLLIVGAILLLPASLYLTATPRFQNVGCVPVACVAVAALALRRDEVWIGRCLVAGGVVFWSVVAWMLTVPS